MGNRLSKIYTRTGDDGTTGLGDGTRVRKDDARVEAYGTVDELNSAIGVLLAVPGLPPASRECLTRVQHELFDLGGELCIPGPSASSRPPRDAARAGARRVQRSAAAAEGIHSARRGRGRGAATSRARSARRAERRAWTLRRLETVAPGSRCSYLNRLSDLLFVSRACSRGTSAAPKCSGGTTQVAPAIAPAARASRGQSNAGPGSVLRPGATSLWPDDALAAQRG